MEKIDYTLKDTQCSHENVAFNQLNEQFILDN